MLELHGEVVGVPVHGRQGGACDALLQSGIFWGVVQVLSDLCYIGSLEVVELERFCFW